MTIRRRITQRLGLKTKLNLKWLSFVFNKEGKIDPTETDFTVSSLDRNGHLKIVKLEPGGVCLNVPLSASVGKGDKVRVGNGEAWVVCTNGLCQILPLFVARDTLHLGGSNIELFVKEISEPGEQVK